MGNKVEFNRKLFTVSLFKVYKIFPHEFKLLRHQTYILESNQQMKERLCGQPEKLIADSDMFVDPVNIVGGQSLNATQLIHPQMGSFLAPYWWTVQSQITVSLNYSNN